MGNKMKQCSLCANYNNTESCDDCKIINGEFSNWREIPKMPEIKDSGERREFPGGGVRDMSAGKGDCASLPAAALLRLSLHYEAGAHKYSRWNYMKGIPISSCIDSALRHLLKYLDGWDDEPHLEAACFNCLTALQMEETHPEMQDLPMRKDCAVMHYPGTKHPDLAGEDNVDPNF